MRNAVSVAMIETVGGHGGMDYYDFGLCRGLMAAGCNVSLYTCDETVDPGTAGLRFYRSFRRIYGRDNRWVRAFRYLKGSVVTLSKAVAHGEKVCHLHLFHGEMQELALVVLAKLSARKVVITVHDVESFSPVSSSRALIGKVYGLADRLIVHNQVSKRELVAKLGISSKNIEVVASGNYMEGITGVPSQRAARSALDISESSKVLLFFGQIKDVKGLDILIEAIPAVAREIPEITLLVAGRPWRNDFSSYERLIETLGIGKRCVLHIRYIPNDELPLYFSAADLVILPYRRIYQSAVILMAMSYGRPVVVSDLPGMLEMVTDGSNGYTFEQGSKDALAERLIEALRDESGRDRVAAQALQHIHDHHDWERIGKSTAEIYRSILSAR